MEVTKFLVNLQNLTLEISASTVKTGTQKKVIWFLFCKNWSDCDLEIGIFI